MSRRVRLVLCASLAANALLGLQLGWRCAAPALAGAPSGNGDLNGDGGIDVADALYLLFFLFRSGPAPEPISGGPAVASAPLATGQGKCYDDRGAEVLCSSPDFPGQDAVFRRGCGSAGRFVDNQDGTISDTCTGLLWTRHTQDINSDLKFDGNDLVSWQKALQYCDGLTLAERSDWRLPNIHELQSLGAYRPIDPSIDSAFDSIAPHVYWSSTTEEMAPSQAWLIEFAEGGPEILPAGKLAGRFHVLAVTDRPR